MYSDSGVIGTFSYRVSGAGVLSVISAVVMLLNLAEKIVIIYAAIKLIMAANIYIRKNR